MSEHRQRHYLLDPSAIDQGSLIYFADDIATRPVRRHMMQNLAYDIGQGSNA